MRMSKKRVALAAGLAASIGAIAALASGTTFGLYSASQASSGNSFTSGTVTVGTGTPTSVTCTITGMVPGDSSVGAAVGSKADTTCTYNVKYTGSVSAWLAVDVAVSNGSTALYDGTATGLQLYLKDGSANSYLTSTAPTAGTTYKTSGGTATSLPAAGITDLLVNTTAATTNTAVAFSLDYALPIASGNTYQGGSATVTLTFHAVQSGNNPLPTACTTIGQQCLPASGFAWS